MPALYSARAVTLRGSRRRLFRGARARGGGARAAAASGDAPPTAEEMAAAQAELQERMERDPAFKEQMEQRAAQFQAAMQSDAAQQEMAAMSNFMSSPAMQERLRSLQDDPELAGFFEDLKTNGPSAMMKYWNDAEMLKKISEKLGGAQALGAAADQARAAAAAGAAGAPPKEPAEPKAPPEVNDLRDAARYGDLEAVEDFVAVGKDVNEADESGRTALHYAVAFYREEANGDDIVRELLGAGADLEARDSKENTPLHYAAGYGRVAAVRLLLEAGASTAAENESGKTPLQVVEGTPPQNPVRQDEALMEQLRPEGAFFTDQ